MVTDSTRRLHHQTPAWVNADAIFHIRIRVDPDFHACLTDFHLAPKLLESALFYHQRATWNCRLLLLMPDHLHALVSFPIAQDMRLTVGRWKAWQVRALGVLWQDNFFDHRIRNHSEFQLKAHYIRQNPVVKKLCAASAEWPWVICPANAE